ASRRGPMWENCPMCGARTVLMMAMGVCGCSIHGPETYVCSPNSLGYKQTDSGCFCQAACLPDGSGYGQCESECPPTDAGHDGRVDGEADSVGSDVADEDGH